MKTTTESFSRKMARWGQAIFDRDKLDFSFHPWRDWRVLVVVFFALETVIISAHFFFYRSLTRQEEKISAAATQTSTDIPEKIQLEKIYNGLQQKLQALEAAKTNSPTVVDPAL